MANNKLVPVYSNSIRTDKPLVFPLYSKDGTLLANRGAILEQDQSLKLLVHGEIFTRQSELVSELDRVIVKGSYTPPSNSVDKVSYKVLSTREKLDKLKNDYIFRLDSSQEKFEENILFISDRLDGIIKQNESSALAYIYLSINRHSKFDFMFSLGIMSGIIVRNLRWKKKERMMIITASLISDFVIHDEKNPDKISLNLESAGITLEKVINYAIKLKNIGNDGVVNIIPHEQDFNFADSLFNTIYLYFAFQHNYKNSTALLPDMAIKRLSKEKFSRYSNYILKKLIEIVGFYPPGCFVKLASKEIALVQSKGNSPDTPTIRIVMLNNGAIQRQTPTKIANQSSLKIIKIVNSSNILNFINVENYWQ